MIVVSLFLFFWGMEPTMPIPILVEIILSMIISIRYATKSEIKRLKEKCTSEINFGILEQCIDWNETTILFITPRKIWIEMIEGSINLRYVGIMLITFLCFNFLSLGTVYFFTNYILPYEVFQFAIWGFLFFGTVFPIVIFLILIIISVGKKFGKDEEKNNMVTEILWISNDRVRVISKTLVSAEERMMFEYPVEELKNIEISDFKTELTKAELIKEGKSRKLFKIYFLFVASFDALKFDLNKAKMQIQPSKYEVPLKTYLVFGNKNRKKVSQLREFLKIWIEKNLEGRV